MEKVYKNISQSIAEFYLTHKPVFTENADTAKVPIVYDASTRVVNQLISLNEYIGPGPNL